MFIGHFILLWKNVYSNTLPISLKDFIHFLEGGEGRVKERERNLNVWEKHQLVAWHSPLTGDLACSPGMGPGQESNQRSFGSQADAQFTEPHEPGLLHIFKFGFFFFFEWQCYLYILDSRPLSNMILFCILLWYGLLWTLRRNLSAEMYSPWSTCHQEGTGLRWVCPGTVWDVWVLDFAQ